MSQVAELLGEMREVSGEIVKRLSGLTEEEMRAQTDKTPWRVLHILYRFAAHEEEHTNQIVAARWAMGTGPTVAQLALAQFLAARARLDGSPINLDQEAASRPPREGEWSVLEILQQHPTGRQAVPDLDQPQPSTGGGPLSARVQHGRRASPMADETIGPSLPASGTTAGCISVLLFLLVGPQAAKSVEEYLTRLYESLSVVSGAIHRVIEAFPRHSDGAAMLRHSERCPGERSPAGRPICPRRPGPGLQVLPGGGQRGHPEGSPPSRGSHLLAWLLSRRSDSRWIGDC